MLQGMPLPGKTRPTARDVYRSVIGQKVDWLTPARKYQSGKDRPGIVACPRCHAMSFRKRWFLNEDLYARVRAMPNVTFVTCPGCRRIQRQVYEGEVVLRSDRMPWIRQQLLALVAHQEVRAREDNPFSQIASIDERGNCIEILTTTRWLAERIGKAVHKAFKGALTIQRPPYEKFARVRWAG